MANHESAKKSIRQNEVRRLRNRANRSKIKTAIKKVLSAITSGDNSEARKILSLAQAEIDKGVTKGVVKKGTASRTIKRLAAKVKLMVKAA